MNFARFSLFDLLYETKREKKVANVSDGRSGKGSVSFVAQVRQAVVVIAVHIVSRRRRRVAVRLDGSKRNVGVGFTGQRFAADAARKRQQ